MSCHAVNPFHEVHCFVMIFWHFPSYEWRGAMGAGIIQNTLN